MDIQEDPELALALRLSMENESQNEDPDLALALRLSMEEQRARQEFENASGVPANMADQSQNKDPELALALRLSKIVPNVCNSKNNPVRKSKHFCGDCDGCKRQDCKKCSSCQDETRKKVCDYRICKKIHTMKYYNKYQYDLFVKKIGQKYDKF